MDQNEIAQALLDRYVDDADRLVDRGVASPHDIDVAMRLGAGYPAGPFEARGAPSSAVPTARSAESPWRAVTVVGTGHMASGIADAVARSGSAVTIVGRTAASLDRSRAAIDANLDRSVRRGRLAASDAAAILGRVAFVSGVGSLPADSDVIIEAVAEDLPVKQDVLAQVDRHARPGAVLATNTSSYRVADVMQGVSASRQTLALHFFNPATVMKLVEVVPGPGGEDVLDPAAAWVDTLGKSPVRSADTRGFIVNRLLIPYLNDAARLHEDGVPIEDVDAAMTTVAGLPMGPFALLDLIGLDVTVAALSSMAEAEPDEERLVPAGILVDLVAEGRLGRKSGTGFYTQEDLRAR
ncbi:3-hydroxyacyl-CoA dehydrogenase NAD-binding domain-containing protein [Microbacterium sp. X-17]|uniref:3-hydroxyacyl-CoA dehydrogenase family protein n=1 Tax=Microbacterium sp. X-17 TaxID=3144404 RepID=UPI0031F54181